MQVFAQALQERSKVWALMSHYHSEGGGGSPAALTVQVAGEAGEVVSAQLGGRRHFQSWSLECSRLAPVPP